MLKAITLLLFLFSSYYFMMGTEKCYDIEDFNENFSLSLKNKSLSQIFDDETQHEVGQDGVKVKQIKWIKRLANGLRRVLPVAVKKISITDVKTKQGKIKLAMSEREIKNLVYLQDKVDHVVKYYCCVYDMRGDSHDIYILMENLFADFDDDKLVLAPAPSAQETQTQSHNKSLFPINMYKEFNHIQKLQFYAMLAKRLLEFHRIGFIHGDIKVKNLMAVNPNAKSVKFIDYEIGGLLDGSSIGGTTYYLDPISLQNRLQKKPNVLTFSRDMWAFGLMFIELELGYTNVFKDAEELLTSNQILTYIKNLKQRVNETCNKYRIFSHKFNGDSFCSIIDDSMPLSEDQEAISSGKFVQRISDIQNFIKSAYPKMNFEFGFDKDWRKAESLVDNPKSTIPVDNKSQYSKTFNINWRDLLIKENNRRQHAASQRNFWATSANEFGDSSMLNMHENNLAAQPVMAYLLI